MKDRKKYYKVGWFFIIFIISLGFVYLKMKGAEKTYMNYCRMGGARKEKVIYIMSEQKTSGVSGCSSCNSNKNTIQWKTLVELFRKNDDIEFDVLFPNEAVKNEYLNKIPYNHGLIVENAEIKNKEDIIFICDEGKTRFIRKGVLDMMSIRKISDILSARDSKR